MPPSCRGQLVTLHVLRLVLGSLGSAPVVAAATGIYPSSGQQHHIQRHVVVQPPQGPAQPQLQHQRGPPSACPCVPASLCRPLSAVAARPLTQRQAFAVPTGNKVTTAPAVVSF
jgi:hypothetical protein